jgi:hypothetical protein
MGTGSKRFVTTRTGSSEEVKCKPEVANTTGQVEDGLAGEVPLVHIERHLVLPVTGPVLELDQHVLREPTANTTNTNQLS